MQITRHNHLRYMARLTPLLLGLYITQVLLYQKFVPGEIASDINLIVGIGLAAIVLLFHLYDQHHRIVFKENYLETRFDLLKIKEEILYKNVVHVEVKTSRFYYGKVTLYTRDGGIYHLHHVDSPDMIAKFIEKKKRA